VATESLDDGVARCLGNRPLETHPPAPDSSPSSRDDRAI
jgi:hypothetical protein